MSSFATPNDQWSESHQNHLVQQDISTAAGSEQVKAVNPEYILANCLAEIAIRKAQDENDYSEIDNLMTIHSDAFVEHADFAHYAGHPAERAQRIEVIYLDEYQITP